MNTALKQARERANLTQVEAAEKAQVSYRAYQNYEAEEREPKVKAAIRIAHTLGTTVEELFGTATSKVQFKDTTRTNGGQQSKEKSPAHAGRGVRGGKKAPCF